MLSCTHQVHISELGENENAGLVFLCKGLCELSMVEEDKQNSFEKKMEK